jgi:hypothetical protein
MRKVLSSILIFYAEAQIRVKGLGHASRKVKKLGFKLK